MSSGRTKIHFKRTKIRNNYAISASAHSQGLFTQNIKNLILEDCWFDHNGWNPKVTGAWRTMFNHGLYHAAVAGNGPVTVINSIFTRNSNHGINGNWGGDIKDSLFLRNAIGIHFKDRPDGQPATIKDTVITESCDRAEDSGYAAMGWGVTFGDMDGVGAGTVPLTPIVVTNTVLAHNASTGNNQQGFNLGNEPKGISITGCAVYKWGNPFAGNPAGNTNVISPNKIDAAGTLNLFSDPTRTVAKYMGTKGKPASNDALYAELRAQRKGNWRPEYNASAVNTYMRAGFLP